LLDLEAEIGIESSVAALFRDTIPQEEKEKEEKEETAIMVTTTYSLGGMSMDFDSEEPVQNTDYEVDVVLSKASRPAAGSDDERKLVEGICKNQYQKFKRAERSMKSIERLLKRRGIMDTITGTTTVLDKYDMRQSFTIVYPVDTTLTKVSLKMKFDGSGPQTVDLLTDFRKVSKANVALSCSWWNLHGFFLNKDNEKQSLSRDMNWSYLHFQNHVGDNLYNGFNKQFLTYEKKQQGGPLFFKLLVDTVLFSNENSLSSLETTIKNYNIAKDGKDDIPEVIKTLEPGALTIQAMRDDGSEQSSLPDKFVVVNLLKVFQTTSVPVFNKKMEMLHSNLDIYRLMHNEKTINTINNLGKTFKMANDFYLELFDEGTWDQATLESAKSLFIVFWKNRCWNCKKENCIKFKCNVPIDEARCEQNRQEWMKENKKEGGGGRRGGKSGKPFAWRPPEAHEDNKRVIYGKPHTWNGRTSWVEDQALSSGLPEAAPGKNLADVPSTIQPKSSDDHSVASTALTTGTALTQEQQNEMRRVSANLDNLGVSLASMKEFMATLTE
jgi:hypothetical protein